MPTEFDPQHRTISRVFWHMPVIPVFKKWRQEAKKFQVILHKKFEASLGCVRTVLGGGGDLRMQLSDLSNKMLALLNSMFRAIKKKLPDRTNKQKEITV